MSEFRFEKCRAEAEVTLSTGAVVRGCFFLAGSSALHQGPERVGDLLNGERGFVPFELLDAGTPKTVLFNRSQITTIALPSSVIEAQLEPGYDLATKRRVSILLSTGTRIAGTVSIYRPIGRDRLSDYAQSDEAFRYVETADRTLIINAAHIVEIGETGD